MIETRKHDTTQILHSIVMHHFIDLEAHQL